MTRITSSASAILILFLTLISTTISIPSQPYDDFDNEAFVDKRGKMAGEIFGKDGKMKRTRINLVEDIEKRGFNFNQKVRGVSVGGWLITEPFITPSLYNNGNDPRIVDEHTLVTYNSNAPSLLESHFSSFITQSDFNQIAAAGLNMVRIPIPYWAVDTAQVGFYRGSQYSKLQQAVGWARSAGLKVNIDLHTAPGSQNGFDNSGRRGVLDWFTKQSYKDRTKAVIQKFASDFASQQDTVVAISLINEPAMTFGPSNAVSFTLDYYNNAYYTARYPSGSTPSNYGIIMHDGFEGPPYWNNQFKGLSNLIIDTHVYTIFSNDQIALSQNDRMSYYCNQERGQIASGQSTHPILVGEFTSSVTDCAPLLNGVGRGARYDGSFSGSSRVGSCQGKSGSGNSFSSTYKSQLRQSFQTQRKVYEQAGIGWTYWTWKTQSADEWSYQKGLQYGWIPKNLGDFSSSYC